ncbi:hypothetical protein Gohar_025128, partial [Gossypium harknessii]|nr:hypothetical protein [Gossypium harknessii]
KYGEGRDLPFRGRTCTTISEEFVNDPDWKSVTQIDAQKPLRRGIFVSTEVKEKVLVVFKYENLPTFYFGCGKMGHGAKDCEEISVKDSEEGIDEFPYSTTLREESTLEMGQTVDVDFFDQRVAEVLLMMEDRRLPIDKTSRKNKNLMLECSWIGESTSSIKTLISVGANGSRGGLCLAWKEDVNVHLRSYSKNHIYVFIKENDNDKLWHFTDFNEVLYSFEKVSGVPREEHSIEAFRKTLDDCQLGDVGYLGNYFTWERENLLETSIKERLYRGVANDDWLNFARGFIFKKLKELSTGLIEGEKMIEVIRNELKCAFSKKLEDLMDEGRDDDNLATLIDV